MAASPRARRLAVAGAVATALVVAGVVASRRRDRYEPDEGEWPELPEGRALHVTSHDGAELAVSVAGPPDADTVVLAHCWMGLRRFWAAVAQRLMADGHQVVVYDQRGHGESTFGDGTPSMADLGHDLKAVLDAVGAHDVVLVGHSMGGMSVQSYAAEHPDDFRSRVRGVVLVSTTARTIGRAVPAIVGELLVGEVGAWRWRGALGRRMARRAIGERAQAGHVDLTLEGVVSTAAAVRSGFLLAMSAMDLRGAGRTLSSVPTRILVGAKDTLTPPRAARALADAITSAELEVIPRAGHMLPLEEPDRIVAAIREVAAVAPAAEAAS